MSGRAAAGVLVLALLALAALLAVVDPFGLFGPAGRERTGAGAGDTFDGQEREAAPAVREAGAGLRLEGLYGAGDLGGLRLRVMDAATNAPRTRQDVRLSGRGEAEQTLATGEDGAVVFGRLAPGRGWALAIEGAGFRAVTVEGFVIRPGELKDLGDVWVGQNVVLRGRVLDPAGRPLAKASVAAYGSERGSPGQGLVVFLVGQALAVPQAKEEVLTDEGGWFRFTTLADGTYALVARHPGHGMRQQNDVVVSPRSASSPVVIRLAEGARMNGRVLDPEGRAVPGARVVALRDVGQRFSLSGTLERDEAVADARGEVRLETLVDGASYRFGVVAEGFAAAWDQAPQEVRRSLEREFRLSRGGWIEGRVTEEGSGTPVADARITVVVGRFSMGGMGGGRGARGGPGAAAPATDPTTPAATRTDAEGRFRLGPLLPGPVMSAVIKASGYASTSASLFGGNAWPDVSVEQPAQVEVQLKRGGSIQGTVRTPDGQPVPGASVVAVQGSNMAAMWVGSPTAVADPQGRYLVDGAPPGEYHLTVDAPGYVLAATGEDASKVTVPAEGGTVTLDLTLSAAGAIVGQVTDGKGEPMAGVRVRTRPALGDLFRGGGPGRGGPGGAGARIVEALKTSADLTDAQGRFRLPNVGSAVDWTVEAEAEEYVPAESARLKVQPGETKEVALVLTAGATLAGRVVGEGGAWVGGARVRIATLEKDEAERPFLSAFEVRRLLDPRVFVADAEGRFTIPNVKPGRVMVQVEHPDYVTWCKRNLTLAADQVLEGHSITLQKGELVEGVVKGADGRPVAGAMVFVTARRNPGAREAEGAPAAEVSESVEPQMSAQSDAEGRFRIENVAPGLYSVVVGFAQGHVGYFGGNDEAAIKRDVNVPVRDLEFRLRAQEAGALPFGPGNRPGGGAPRPPGTGAGR